jgi:hypothetical protein
MRFMSVIQEDDYGFPPGTVKLGSLEKVCANKQANLPARQPERFFLPPTCPHCNI